MARVWAKAAPRGELAAGGVRSALSLSPASWGPFPTSRPRAGPASSWAESGRGGGASAGVRPSPREPKTLHPFGTILCGAPSLLRGGSSGRIGRLGRWDTPLVLSLTGELMTSSRRGPRVPGSQQSGVRGADARPGGLPGTSDSGECTRTRPHHAPFEFS